MRKIHDPGDLIGALFDHDFVRTIGEQKATREKGVSFFIDL
ncbi:MAG: hypothetical protein JWR87_3949 [Segetibacter sp.]|jgi:hypothetical protein|nr:hypothetical protein [Segetibacter sp.]